MPWSIYVTVMAQWSHFSSNICHFSILAACTILSHRQTTFSSPSIVLLTSSSTASLARSSRGFSSICSAAWQAEAACQDSLSYFDTPPTPIMRWDETNTDTDHHNHPFQCVNTVTATRPTRRDTSHLCQVDCRPLRQNTSPGTDSRHWHLTQEQGSSSSEQESLCHEDIQRLLAVKQSALSLDKWDIQWHHAGVVTTGV